MSDFWLKRSWIAYLVIFLICLCLVNRKDLQRQRERYVATVFSCSPRQNGNDGILYFDYLTRINPKDHAAFANLGTCHYHEGDYQEALRNLTKAVELQPDSKRYREQLSAVLISQRIN